jgi:hypothetical protein
MGSASVRSHRVPLTYASLAARSPSTSIKTLVTWCECPSSLVWLGPDDVRQSRDRSLEGGAVVSGAVGMPQLGLDVVCHNHPPPGDEVDDEPPLDEHLPMTAVAVTAAAREANFRPRSMSGCLLRSLLVSARTGRRLRYQTESGWRLARIISTYSLRWQCLLTARAFRDRVSILVNGTVPPNSALQRRLHPGPRGAHLGHSCAPAMLSGGQRPETTL